MPANQNTVLGVLSGLGLIIFAGYETQTRRDFAAALSGCRLVTSSHLRCVLQCACAKVIAKPHQSQTTQVSQSLVSFIQAQSFAPLEVYYTNMEVRWKPSHNLLNNNMVLWVYWEMGCLGFCLFSPSFSAKNFNNKSRFMAQLHVA